MAPDDDKPNNGDNEADAANAAARAEVAAGRAKSAAHEADTAATQAEEAAREARHDAERSGSEEAKSAAEQAAEDADSARKAAGEARAVAGEADREAQVAAAAARKGDSIPAQAAAASAETAAFIAQADAENAMEYAEEAREEEIRADRASWRVPPMEETPPTKDEGGAVPALYLAEFETTHDVLHAAEKVRDAGFKRWDVHTPFPIHGMDDAMGLGQSHLGWIVLALGLTGCFGGFLMMMWMNGIDYPIVIGGKPPESIPSMIPIIFECTILFSGIGAVFGMLTLNGLPRHHHPVFHSTRFEACSDDKFFISVEAADPKFDTESTKSLLESLRPSHLELIEEVAS